MPLKTCVVLCLNMFQRILTWTQNKWLYSPAIAVSGWIGRDDNSNWPVVLVCRPDWLRAYQEISRGCGQISDTSGDRKSKVFNILSPPVVYPHSYVDAPQPRRRATGELVSNVRCDSFPGSLLPKLYATFVQHRRSMCCVQDKESPRHCRA